jgi:hypothetical protein
MDGARNAAAFYGNRCLVQRLFPGKIYAARRQGKRNGIDHTIVAGIAHRATSGAAAGTDHT